LFSAIPQEAGDTSTDRRSEVVAPVPTDPDQRLFDEASRGTSPQEMSGCPEIRFCKDVRSVTTFAAWLSEQQEWGDTVVAQLDCHAQR
jgi:hypothetical protein